MKSFFSFFSSFILANIFAQTTANVQFQGHPRVLVTTKDVAVLQQKIHHQDFKEIYKSFQQQKDFITDGISVDGEPNEDIRQKIEVLAFSYLLDTVKEKQAGKIGRAHV